MRQLLVAKVITAPKGALRQGGYRVSRDAQDNMFNAGTHRSRTLFGHQSRLVHVLRSPVEYIIPGTWYVVRTSMHASAEPAKRTGGVTMLWYGLMLERT